MNLAFPALLRFGDVALLLLRLMVSAVFFDSGLNHLRNPTERAKGIGASPGFTAFLGTAEVAGSAGVALGILTQLAAIGLILIMLGAIQKKIFVWKIGFLGRAGLWLALRLDAGRDEPRHRDNRGRQARPTLGRAARAARAVGAVVRHPSRLTGG